MANSGLKGLTKYKTYADDETLTNEDLNASLDQFFNEVDASSLGSNIDNAAEARVTQDPGTYASPTIPVNQEDVNQQIFYLLGQIIGGTNSSHLDTIPTTLTTVAGSTRDVAFGLEFEGLNNGGSSATEVLSELITRGAIINAASLSSADVTVSDFDNTNVKFGSYAYSLGSGNILAYPGSKGSSERATVSAWFRSLAAGDYIAYNPLLGVELYCEGVSGFLEAKVTEKIAATESTKSTNTVTGASSRTGDTTFRNAVMQYRVNDQEGASTDLVKLYYEGSAEGTAITSADVDINAGHGGVWFIGAKRNDPTWDHFYAASGLPTAHSTAWTSNGTPGATVSNGILNISTSGTTGYFSLGTLVDLTQQTIEWKSRVNTVDDRSSINENVGMCVQVLDDSFGRSVRICATNTGIVISNEAAGTPVHEVDIDLSTDDWHVFRLTSVQNGSDADMKFYINGVLVHAWTNTETDATATDHIRFGTIGSGTVDIDIEYFKIYDAGAEAPVAASSQGQIDSFGIAKTILSDTIITSLQSSRFTSVLQDTGSYGISLPPSKRFKLQTNTTSTSTTYEDTDDSAVYYIAGDGLTEFIFHASYSAANANAGRFNRLTIDIDNDANGASGTNSTFFLPFSFNTDTDEGVVSTKRTKVLKPGLHEIRPNVSVDAGTATYTGTTQQFNVWKRQEGEVI